MWFNVLIINVLIDDVRGQLLSVPEVQNRVLFPAYHYVYPASHHLIFTLHEVFAYRIIFRFRFALFGFLRKAVCPVAGDKSAVG